MRRTAWLARGVLVLAALYLLYLGVANTLLNSEWARGQVDRAPERLTLTWSSAWTGFPGHLRVTRLTVEGRTARRTFSIEAENVTARFALLPLLSRELRLSRLEAAAIHHARLDDYRMEGDGRLALDGAHWHAGQLAADRLDLAVSSGVLLHGDTPLAEEIRLDADLRLAPFSLAEHPGSRALRFVSGRLALAGRGDAHEVFRHHLAGLEWLEVDGHGDLEGEIGIERGRLLPGSEVRLDSPRLGVVLDESHWLEGGERYRVSGAGTIRAVLDRHPQDSLADEVSLELALDGMQMFAAGESRALLVGDGFRLGLTAPTPALDGSVSRLNGATLFWQGAEADDIGVFGRYLPEHLPLRLTSGEARLHGGLRYLGAHVEGAFELEGDDVTVAFGERRVVGQLGLSLAIPELDVRQGKVDLSGTRVELQAASAPDDPRPLTTSLALPIARFHSPVAWSELDETLDAGDIPWEAELELVGRLANLGFLDAFLSELFDERGLSLEGGGELRGHFYLAQGRPQEGSRLEIRSEHLAARFLDFRASGTGRADIALHPGAPVPEAHLSLALNEVDLDRLSDARRLFQARRLDLSATAGAHRDTRPGQASIAWQDASLPDVSVLNAYLPTAAPFRLDAGRASSDGRFELEGTRAHGHLHLAGDAIAGRFAEERFAGRLNLALAIRELDTARQRLDLSGSRLEVLTASDGGGDPLRTLLAARRARLSGGIDWPGNDAAPRQPLGGELRLEGMLTQLGFLNAFLPDEHGLEIQGDGRLSADLLIDDGEVAEGSQLRIHSNRLRARFMHYEAAGDGSLILETTPSRGASLEVSLPSFDLRHRDQGRELIEGRLLRLSGRADRFALPEGLRTLETHIDMPYVVAPSLAAFNDYLPEDAGIELLSGRAELATRLDLVGAEASGSLSLRAPDARLRLDEQVLGGALRLDTRLAGGDLERMNFDVSGSRLSLEGVRLEGDDGRRIGGWWAHLTLPEGRMIWRTPLALEASLDLAMRDSGLLVNLFVDAARQRRWLRDLLTVEDVRGTANLSMDDETLRLHELAIHGGERLELLAALTLSEARLTGRMFARYGPLRLGVGIDPDGRRRWHWRQPRQWYERGAPR